MLLESLVKQVLVLERTIAELNTAMRHVSPASVNALRGKKEELQNILDELMDSCVVANFDLEYMLSEHGECLRDCIRPSYTGKPVVLPKPKWDTPPPPPPPEPPVASVPGVNLLVYIDTSGSMRGTLGASGAVRKELIAFANYLKNQSTRANIPCTVSLVWFGDRTDVGGDGENYYTVSMRKESVANFETKIKSPVWYKGGIGLPESGILCMKQTLPSLVVPGVANTLIYITDAPSKSTELGATPSAVKNLFTSNKVNAYAIIPKSKEPNINSLFTEVKEFTDDPYSITPWAEKTLNP